MSARRGVDFAAYVRAVREGPSFVCRIVRGDAALLNPIVLDTGDAIAWVNPYQTLLGYTLVAPKEHREHVTGDFSVDEYVDLQRVVHRVGEAVRRAVPCERLYVLSLGSQQGNRHVHWHVVPLPPGLHTKSNSWRRCGSRMEFSICPTKSSSRSARASAPSWNRGEQAAVGEAAPTSSRLQA